MASMDALDALPDERVGAFARMVMVLAVIDAMPFEDQDEWLLEDGLPFLRDVRADYGGRYYKIPAGRAEMRKWLARWRREYRKMGGNNK